MKHQRVKDDINLDAILRQVQSTKEIRELLASMAGDFDALLNFDASELLNFDARELLENHRGEQPGPGHSIFKAKK